MNGPRLCLLALALCLPAGGFAADRTPPQFKVWGTIVPDGTARVKDWPGLKELKPPESELGPEFGVKDGFHPYSCAPTDSLNYLRRPSPAALLRPELRAIVAQGEYEAAALGIYAAKTGQLQAALSELKNAQGNALPPECLDLRWVRQVPYPHCAGLWRLEPLILEKRAEVDAQAGQSSYLWLTVYAPEGQPGGLYVGALKIAGTEIPVKVKVLPFALPKPTQLFAMLYGLKRGNTGNPDNLENELLDMREHGMNHLAYCQNQPAHVKNPDGNFSFDFDAPRYKGNTPPATILDTAVKVGLDRAYFTHYHDVGAYSPYKWGSPDCDRYYTQLAKAWKLEAAKRHWPEIFQDVSDEPHGEFLNVAEKHAQLVKAADPSIKVSGFTSGTYFNYAEWEVLPDFDRYIISGGDRKRMESIRKAGKDFLIYNQVSPTSPKEGRRLGHLMDQTGALGFQQFMYRIMEANGNPASPGYVPKNGENTVWVYSYEGKDGLLPTPTFEMIREGVDDLRYLALFRQLRDQAANREVAAELDAQITANLAQYNNFNPDGSYRGGSWLDKLPGDSFDLTRQKLVSAILKLKKLQEAGK